MTTIELTATEIACGVTEAQAVAARHKAYMTLTGIIVMPNDVGPAVAYAGARLFAGGPVVFYGVNLYGHPLYERKHS